MKLKPYEHWFSKKGFVFEDPEEDYSPQDDPTGLWNFKNKKVVKQIYGRDEKGKYDLFIYEDGSQDKVYL